MESHFFFYMYIINTLHMTIFSTFSFFLLYFIIFGSHCPRGAAGVREGAVTRRAGGLCGGCGVARSPVRARMTSNSQELHEFVQLLPTQSLAKK
jgi:hypothetical protein